MTSQLPPLPLEASHLINAYIQGLLEILSNNLYGIYMYGAGVFPDSGPLLDIDCHVIIRQSLTEAERAAYLAMLSELKVRFPALGEQLDAYVILLEAAKGHQIPQHQVLFDIYDHSWALHCAHVRAGYYRVLYGPEPDEIFPNPTWDSIDGALQHELKFVLDHPQYPAYGILNLCRILYSYETKNPAVSKQFSGRWGQSRFPEWAPLIQAARRFYYKEHTPQDLAWMEWKREAFFSFMQVRMSASRELTI